MGNKALGVRRHSWVPRGGRQPAFGGRGAGPQAALRCAFSAFILLRFGPVVLYFTVILNTRHGVEKVYGCYEMCLRREP